MILRIVAEDVVDDRKQVGQALAGAGTGRNDVVLALPGDPKRFFLVAVQRKVLAEEARCFGKNDAFARERLSGRCRARMRD